MVLAAMDIDQDMPMQDVYIKSFSSAVTIKARLKALDKHRYRNNRNAPFDDKHRRLVGRDLSETGCYRVDPRIESMR